MSQADNLENEYFHISLIHLNVGIIMCLSQVVADMPRFIDTRRNPAALILSTGLAWAAVTLSASAADLSAGTCTDILLPMT